MRKAFSGIALSLTMIGTNMAPVLANPTTNLKTDNGVTVNSVVPKSSLIEIEGRTLTDAEAAKVEGEAFFIPLLAFGVKAAAGASLSSAINRGATHFGDCRHGVRRDCSVRSHGRSFVSGATFGIWR